MKKKKNENIQKKRFKKKKKNNKGNADTTGPYPMVNDYNLFILYD